MNARKREIEGERQRGDLGGGSGGVVHRVKM